MEIGLLLNSDSRLFPDYSEKFREILERNSIPFRLIDPNSNSLLKDLKECSHLIFRHSQGDTDILLYEAVFNIAKNVFHIKCSPDYETFWPYENKVKEYYLLKSYEFPVVDSNIFWNYTPAFKFLKQAQFPIVAKLKKGAGSSNVVIINSLSDGKKIVEQVFKKGVKPGKLKSKTNLASLSKVGVFKFWYEQIKSQLISLGILGERDEYPEWQIQRDSILFQKYLPDNKFDTRVTIIGKRAFAFRRYVRSNDFRASGSGNFDLDPHNIDTKCLEIAFSISKKLNFETMAYDFIYDENKDPFICEISYCFTDWIVKNCPGYWDESLNWHAGHNWPQYYQLVDFLQKNDLESVSV